MCHKIDMRVSPELKDQLSEIAAAHNMAVSEFVRITLEYVVSHNLSDKILSDKEKKEDKEKEKESTKEKERDTEERKESYARAREELLARSHSLTKAPIVGTKQSADIGEATELERFLVEILRGEGVALKAGRLSPAYVAKCTEKVYYGGMEYASPATLYATDPDFKSWAASRVQYFLSSDLPKIQKTLVGLISKYDALKYGWFDYKKAKSGSIERKTIVERDGEWVVKIYWTSGKITEMEPQSTQEDAIQSFKSAYPQA